MSELFYRVRNWYNKNFNFYKYWDEYCKKNYCANCKDKNEGCFIEYTTGKCFEWRDN